MRVCHIGLNRCRHNIEKLLRFLKSFTHPALPCVYLVFYFVDYEHYTSGCFSHRALVPTAPTSIVITFSSCLGQVLRVLTFSWT